MANESPHRTFSADELLERFGEWRARHPSLSGIPLEEWWVQRVELGLVGHTSPVYSVHSFQFRTVNPTTTGANASFDASDPDPMAAVTGFSVDSNNRLRIRFEVEETASGSGNQAFSLQYRINGGTWTTIGTGTTGVRLYDGTGFADGAATTNLIVSDIDIAFAASSRTFLAGTARDTTASSGTISWSGNQHTELDWLVEFVSADLNNGDQIEFQLDAGSQLATPPKATVAKTPTNVIQDAFRIRGPQAASVAANAAFDVSDPAIDTDVTWAPLTRRFRIRFRLRNTGSSVTQAYKLQYRINAGSWTDVANPGPGHTRAVNSTSPVEILDNSGYTDGAATTELLAGPGTFVAGTAQSTTLTTASIALGANQETELEWTLWLNEYWDTPGHFVDGDTVDFRVVTSAGVALSGGYGTSDANIPRVTIDLNGTTGLAPGAGHMGGIWAENPGHLPIFWDSNGNGYWLVEQTETYPELMMLKTTDGGDSWAQIDQANKPATGDLEGCSIRQVGDTLHIAHHAGGGTDAVRYHTFRMSDHGTSPDTWGLKDEDVYPSFTDQRDQASAIAVRSNGEIIIAFTENVTGQVVKVARRNTSGTWQTPVDVWTGSTNGFTGVTGIQIGDDLYLFAHNDDTGNLLGKRYTSANALEDLYGTSVAASATGTVVATTTGTNLDDEQNYTVPVAWNDGSDKIFIAWVNPTDDDLEGVTITVGSGGSVSSIGGPANSADNVPTGLGQSRQPTASIARDPDNGDLYAVFAREATTAGDNTLYYAVSTDDGATWGTNTAVTLRDLYGSRVNWVRATVQTVGGSKALRIVYDNANLYELYSSAADAQEAGVVTGHIWYDEVVLSSTTAVGKQFQALWNVTGAVGDQSQAVWNVLTPIGDQAQAVWNVSTAIGDEAQAVWNVAGILGDEVQSLWNVTSTVGDQAQTVWDVLTPVGDESQQVWNVSAIAGGQSQYVWNVAGLLGDEVQAVWNIGAAVGDQAQAVWNVWTTVGDQSQTVWDVHSVLGDQVATAWDVAGILGDEVSANWNILAAASDEVVAVWSVLALAGDNMQSVWDIRAFASDQTALEWEVNGPVGDEASAVWDILAIIGDESSAIWDIWTTIGDEAQALWLVAATVSDQTGLVWDIAGVVADELESVWDIAAIASDAASFAWDIEALATASLESLWDLRANLANQLSTVWDVAGLIGDEAAVVWDILTAYGEQVSYLWDIMAAVGDESSHLWNIIAWASDQLDVQWDVEENSVAGKSSTFRWNVLVVQGDSIESVWDVAAILGDSSAVVWNIHAVLGESLQSVWDVAGIVGDETVAVWDLLAVLGDQAGFTWNIRANVSDEVALEWHVSTPVGDEMALVWDVYGDAAGDLLAILWDVTTPLGDQVGVVWDNLVSLADQVAFQWDLLLQAGESTVALWDVDGFAGDQVESYWSIAGYAGDQSSIVWDVAVPAGDEVQSVWDVAGLVSDETSSVWAVEQHVSDDLDAVWNVAGILGDSAALVWDALGEAGTETELQWSVEGGAGSNTTILWSLIGPAGDQAAALWHVSGYAPDQIDIMWRVLVGIDIGLIMRTPARQYAGPVTKRYQGGTSSIEGSSASSIVEGEKT